jgi:apolipoprotein N-acyltransferase
VARAVNMGISAVIDGNGRVLAPKVSHLRDVFVWEVPSEAEALPVARWHEYKKVAGLLLASVPLDTRNSLYAQWGDWFALGCSGGLLLLMLWINLRKHFRKTP